MSDVFISYSRLDKDFVGRLREALSEQGQDVWIDWESIPPSQAWWNEIKKGIARANNFVVVLSPNSMASPICHLEIEYARQLGKRIIPVLHKEYDREDVISAIARRLANPEQDATRKLWGNRQPHDVYDANDSEVKHINYFFFSPEDDFPKRFAELLEVIRTDYEHKEQHTNLELRAQEWLQQNRNESFLLIYDELLSAQQWLQSAEHRFPKPTKLQREYVQASEKRTRQLNRIRRISIIGSAVSLVAILLLIAAFLIGARTAEDLNNANTQIADANELRSTVEFEATFFTDQRNRDLTLIPGVGIVPTREVPLYPPDFYATVTQIAVLNVWEPMVDEEYLAEYRIEMVLVPAGCFMMGSSNGEADERPTHKLCLHEAFWIDRYEVTNGQFADFDGQAEQVSCKSQEADHPRECISWYEARDFCATRGARLPTEAEWEYAARGPDSLIYPWGNSFVADNVVYLRNSSDTTAAVGPDARESGKSWVGAFDLSGNVWEWTSTIYDQTEFPYPYVSTDGRESDNTGFRVLRGGSWFNFGLDVRTTNRSQVLPGIPLENSGFRCARLY